MSSPYPQLQRYPLSGLNFSWAFTVIRPGHWSGSMSAGTEGVIVTEEMLVYWDDLVDPLVNMLGQLLGFSIRTAPGFLSRILPFQHPTFTQLWCTRISSVAGIQDRGIDSVNVVPLVGNVKVAPTSQFTLAKLTLQFTRPHYAVLADNDPLLAEDQYGYAQEWNRYTDRFWTPSTQMLSSEREQFIWAEGAPGGRGVGFNDGQISQGSFGKRVQRQKLKRTWYELPEAGVYDSNGYPINLIENQFTLNVTGAVAGSDTPHAVGKKQIRLTIDEAIPGLCPFERVTVRGVTGTTEANGYWAVGDVSGGGDQFDLIGSIFINNYVNGGLVTTDQIGGLINNQIFFGQPIGTLLYENVEITPRDLQVPPALMGILSESVQLQYNVTFHFERFNPTLGSPGVNGIFPVTGGHQTAPWSNDYQFYPLRTKYGIFRDSNGNTVGGGFYPFGYGYFPTLWNIL